MGTGIAMATDPGRYEVTETIVIGNGEVVRGPYRIVPIGEWTTGDPVVEIQAGGVLEGVVIDCSEADGAPDGVHMTGDEATCTDVHVIDGYHPFFAFGTTETPVRNVRLLRCEAHRKTRATAATSRFGFRWEFTEGLRMERCMSTGAWLDGAKPRAQNDDWEMLDCVMSGNGISLDDAGLNGNGVDLYSGGGRGRIHGGRYCDNGGSGIEVKSGPLSNELSFVDGERGFGRVEDIEIIGPFCAGNRGPGGSGISITRSDTGVLVEDDWAPGTSYDVGDMVWNEGLLYICTGAGTSGSGDGPSGRTDGIDDGTVQWCYYARPADVRVIGAICDRNDQYGIYVLGEGVSISRCIARWNGKHGVLVHQYSEDTEVRDVAGVGNVGSTIRVNDGAIGVKIHGGKTVSDGVSTSGLDDQTSPSAVTISQQHTFIDRSWS